MLFLDQDSIKQLTDQHELLKLRYNEQQQRKYELAAALEQDKAVIEQLNQRLEYTEKERNNIYNIKIKVETSIVYLYLKT